MAPPRGHILGQSGSCRLPEMPSLGMESKRHDKVNRGQQVDQALTPGSGAFPARRKIGTLEILTGEAEPHGQDGKLGRIVESLGGHAQPVSQTVT